MNLKGYLPEEKRTPFLLGLILVAAFALRCWRLTYQSYWVDELHTMNEADPDMSLSLLFFFLKCCDQHPPLHYLLCRLCFSVFGHTEFVGRFISVVFGTAGVWAMWLLGKEVYNKRLGLIAAALTCVNYFHIYYSQEARNYIVVFFFTALSFACFFRLVKGLKKKEALLYAGFTLLMMYTHYYGLFIAVSQFFVVLLLLLLNKTDRTRLFYRFLLAGGVITAGYLPWLPFVLEASAIRSFWISPVKPGFIKDFFRDYFGGVSLVIDLSLLALACYIFQVFKNRRLLITGDRAYNPLALSFLVFFTTTFLTYLIPYLRSVLVVPMLFNRYTIVVVPAILMTIAFGISCFRSAVVRTVFLSLLAVLSLADLVLKKHFYTTIRKTQFREVTSYMASAGKNYPVINQLTSWHQQYYLKRFHYTGEAWTGNKEDLVDSVLHQSGKKYAVKAFWIVGFHGEGKLAPGKRAALDTAYTLVKDTAGFDAWAELYVSKRPAGRPHP